MSKENEVIDLSEEFSFSFDEESPPSDKYEEEIQNLTNQRDLLLKEINVLLENLKKDPGKAVIKWPNRLQDIEKFQAKLNKIIEG